jgi:bifunctional NMN adenylyltransferase/nudix hydrolase
MSLPTPTDVGVVVGRFQVQNFHIGHRSLLDLVKARHQRVLVLLGSPAWRGGKDDPLDYHTRALMFQTEYPTFLTVPITDAQSDEDWSEEVDRLIKSIFPFAKVTLYGARDSFISHYRGRYQPWEVPQTVGNPSGTECREQTAALPLEKESFRAGVIYGISNNPGRMAPCVDGAVLRWFKGYRQVLLIQKPGEKLWRFPGGKLETDDESLESAVNREVREETGVEVGKPLYVASGNLPDWRAVAAGITIHSSLFALPYVFGAPRGGDDAARAIFFDLEPLEESDMEVCHKKLMVKLQEFVRAGNLPEAFNEAKPASAN